MNRLTDEIYWSNGYRKRKSIVPVSITKSVNYCNLKLFERLNAQNLADKRVLELGGGGSSWLAYLASRFPSSKFVGLDYSEAGCKLLKDYADEHGLNNLDYRCMDFFEDDSSLGMFDLVYSLGVVEHFVDLVRILARFKSFVAPNGIMMTVVPNMAGVIGQLTRLYNKGIYDIHVPYDLAALVQGHRDAGMIVEDCGYICSSNFGVLSSCFTDQRGFGYSTYKWLSRLSKLLWLFESKCFDLPKTAYWSPQLYVKARVSFEA